MALQLSVIIPVHETPPNHLRAALTSLCRQSTSSSLFDVLIVQDGVQSDLSALTSGYGTLSIAILRLEIHRGVAAARNLALIQSESPYVLLLDSDDALLPTCIEAFLSFVSSNPGHDLYFSNAIKYSKDLRRRLRTIESNRYMEYYRRFHSSIYNPLYHSVFVGHAVVLRRRSILAIGGFEETKPCAELTDAVLRLHAAGYAIAHIDAVLYAYRNAPQGLSKHPRIHAERAASIKRTVRVLHDRELAEIAPLGRVSPYGHMHYLLRQADGEQIEPPYVDYDSMQLKNHWRGDIS